MTGAPLWPFLLAPADQGRDDLCLVGAHGHRVRFADGRELLCGTSGLWNVNLGYGNAAIADAIAEAAMQASYLGVFRYEHDLARRAAAALIEVCDPARYARVLFSTSGGAANDLAMKLARHYHVLRGEARRTVMVGLKESYHGLTYGAFSLTGDDLGQRVYGVDQRSVRHLAPNAVDQLHELMAREGRRIAAVVVEPVLGNGTLPLTNTYVDTLLELRDQHGFLLVADEVATGFGRTGDFLATQRWSGSPDVLLLSKGLTNGTCAASAVLTSPAVAIAFTEAGALLSHAETQAGTAITSAAILATLAEFERMDAVTRGRQLADLMATALARPQAFHPLVDRVTGQGCFRSLRIRGAKGGPASPSEVAAMVAAVRTAGAIVHPGPGGIQLIPALTYSQAELNELLNCVLRGLDAMSETPHAANQAAA